ncbi:MAG TPA: diguanylate cyclase [Candidimonas sp.]|nr:diguanylate cyclase [Candidimonas sp.]
MSAVQPMRPQLPRWRSHAWRPGLFILALLLALAVYWTLLQTSHTQMREQVRTDAQRLAGQTGQALALQMNTVVRKLDYFSQHLGWAWLQRSQDTFHDAASVAIRTLPPGALAQIAIADAEGKILYSSLGEGLSVNRRESTVFITDREHFQVHSTADKPFLFISEPIKGRISQQWAIQFTRGLWHNGQFQGVIVLSVSAEYLTTALKAIFPDRTDAASLIKSNGAYLARSYHLADVLGKNLPKGRPFIEHPELTHGTYEAVAEVDRISRLYSWHRVDDYPLIILVGLGSEKAMAVTDEAINDSYWQSGFGSALLLLAGLTLAWLWAQRSRHSTQLQRVADALQASEAQLRITLDAVRDGLWTFNHATDTAQWDDRIRTMLDYGEDYRTPSTETLIKLIHPGDLEHLSLENTRLFSRYSNQLMNLEFRLRKADGRWLWVRARGRAIEWNERGTPLRSVGTLSDISEQVAEAHLRDALLNRSAAAILLVSPDRRIVHANAQFASIFLKPGQNLKDLNLRDIHIDQAHWEELSFSYDAVKADGLLRLEYPFTDAGGNVRWFDTHAVPQDPDDPQSNVIWTWIDITSRHEADAALAIETLRLNTLLECFPGGVLIEDAHGTVVFVNPSWPQLLGLEIPAAALQGKHDHDLRELVGSTVSGWLRSHQPGRTAESRRAHEVTTLAGRHLEIHHVEIRQNRQHLGSVWLVRDITERKLHELELAQLASTDTLTALPNRRSFMQSLNALYGEALNVQKMTGVIMMLDIDHFKRVNDTYGHAVGDIVLRHIAKTMKAALRANDVPGRLGGEEFAILLPHTGLAEGLAIAERIRQGVEQTNITANGHDIRITISIGVSVVCADYTPDAALQQADDVLYKAKEAGRNRVCLWQEAKEIVA